MSCEKCGETDFFYLREVSPGGFGPMVLCHPCRRDIDTIISQTPFWPEILKINHLIRGYTNQVPDDIDEDKIKAFWDLRFQLEEKLRSIIDNWLEGAMIINIEGLDIEIKKE